MSRDALNSGFCTELAEAIADRGRSRETIASSRFEDVQSHPCEI